jgi:hypothetical protein
MPERRHRGAWDEGSITVTQGVLDVLGAEMLVGSLVHHDEQWTITR